jgi:hypothetical protein
MAISPFSARPASPEGERRRARLALAIATLGIAATLLAYAISPGVRHAVGHAAHSVKHAVSHVLDPDRDARKHFGQHPQLVQPLHVHGKAPSGRPTAPTGAGTGAVRSTGATGAKGAAGAKA